MNEFLDEKEKRYIECFGEAIVVAHNVITEPHVDVYVFASDDGDEHYYLTKGLEEAGFREALVVTEKNEQWPPFFLQAIASFQIDQKEPAKEMETYDNVEKIKDCGKFKSALFLSADFVGFDKNETKEGLGLKKHLLYTFPITDEEVRYSLDNSREALLEKLEEETSLLGSVKRPSVI